MACDRCAVHVKYFKFKCYLSGLTVQKTVDIEGIFFLIKIFQLVF